MATPHEDEGEREARRILERVARETDPNRAASLVHGAAKGARHRFAAADVDQTDKIEYWGTRIGRALGLVLTVLLMVWLGYFILRGS
jgi:hypothetical protein